MSSNLIIPTPDVQGLSFFLFFSAHPHNLLWLSLYTFEVLISSKQIFITHFRMTHHWISWSIYTHHHSNGSYTSGWCELFQTLFVWAAYTVSDSTSAWTRVWPLNTSYVLSRVCHVKHLQCKKVWPSKIDSYLEVNAWTDWRHQDLISEYSQGVATTNYLCVLFLLLIVG